ncbi:hypothetical protein ACIQUQ_30570 [Streptomyces sp. NPDC101118]|uniref:hypothetical protein n=1 Tax=Streptomyces sp. NPDC101118 TaxID=3366109 RepID=UPI0037F1BBAB
MAPVPLPICAPPPHPRLAAPPPSRLPLLAVCLAYTALQLLAVVPGSPLGWDETVYVSQVSPQAPAAFFSAPRARGITLLAAPVTLVTTGTTALHVWFALLSGAALYLSFAVWRPLLPSPVVTTAAGLFAGLWVTLLYGPQVMPNLWVAFGALAAVGCFLRCLPRRPADPLAAVAGRAYGAGSAYAPGSAYRTDYPHATDLPYGTARAYATDLPYGTARAYGPPAARTAGGRARPLAGLAAAAALVALMRPADALWLLLPLAAVALWRRAPLVLAVLCAGLAVGGAEWVVEAYLRYGGPAARLHRAGEIQGGFGWHPAFADQLRALTDGRTLCRPCEGAVRRPLLALWWLLLPVATAAGLFLARPLRPALAVATAAAASLAVPYLLLLGYAAPRFLLPAYALLSLPVAAGLVAAARPSAVRPDAARRAGARPGRAAALALALALAAHLAVQFAVLDRVADRARESGAAFERLRAELRRHGVVPPCVVTGYEAVRLGYALGCASRQVGGHDGSIEPAGLQSAALSGPVALLTADAGPPPPYARDWDPVPLPPLPGTPELRAFLSPSTTNTPAERAISSPVRQQPIRKATSNHPSTG